MAGTQRGRAESVRAEGAASRLTHLAFVQSLLDHPSRAARVAGREVLHAGAGVAHRVEAIRRTGAGRPAAWKERRPGLDTGGREAGGLAWLSLLRPQTRCTAALARPPTPGESSGQRPHPKGPSSRGCSKPCAGLLQRRDRVSGRWAGASGDPRREKWGAESGPEAPGVPQPQGPVRV